MTTKRTLRQVIVASVLLVAVFCQGTWTLAGTTGSMSGIVTEAGSSKPVSNGQVTVTSPSQQATTQTDASGHFIFASLAPDTYNVTVTKTGYDPATQPGVSVFADQNQQVALAARPSSLKEIGAVSARASGDLVKSGTTADVYSVNATVQDKVSALGGGGSLNSAYSAIATVPGAFVPIGQTGYFQTVHIRGGDYDQVGYELDGVPVNRSFDNYPSGAASSLGQQELQVYTGATPATSEGQGLAGYINQVIRTGSYPGFGNISLGVGSPSFYHKLTAETGGATPNRNFSYYVGAGGYNQEFRYVDQQNAAGYTYLGAPVAPLPAPAAGPGSCLDPATGYVACYASGVGPGGYQLFPYQYGALNGIADRDVVANVHIALPHKRDSGKDDIQLLFDSGYLHNSFYSSTNDAGGAAFFGGAPTFSDSFGYTGPVGVAAPANIGSFVTNYYYPSSPGKRAYGAAIPLDARDVTQNSQEVFKLSYQKNFSSAAYLRLYGYTYYSDWLQYGPNGANLNYIGTGASPDYELNAHTRGLSAQFVDQFNEKNLVTVQGSYTTSSTLRDNNTQLYNGGGKRSRFAVLTDPNAINNPANPNYGVCYTYTGLGAATPASCSPSANNATFLTYACAQANTCAVPPGVGPGGAALDTCGTGPCTYYVAENGLYATYNTVTPTFSAVSITDNFRPSDKWLFNIGLRSDTFKYQGSSTNPNDAARQFWFAAFNKGNCQNTVTGAPTDRYGLGLAPGASCTTAGAQYKDLTAANGNALVNASAQTLSYTVFQPRFGGTYTINPDTVLRFSAGKYVEPPNSAFEQYNTLQENLPAFLGTAFYKYGFYTPGHAIKPPTSYNYDFSYERHMKGTDVSFKFTPFLRKTKDQIQQFFLDQASGFVSGLNVGRQTSEGFEFQLNKGDFGRNGLAASLAFTYTNSFIKYDTLSNGTTVVSGINADIANYNALTSVCHNDAVAHGGTASNSQCGAGSAASASCYVNVAGGGATASPCGAPGAYGNPYWNAPIAPGLDPGANYPTYDLFPGPIGSSAQAFGAPYLATVVLNYKHDRYTITPSLQFQGGARYGAPETTPGIDPTAGCLPLAVQPPTDTRSGYPNPGPAYDARTCAGALAAIPNIYTGKFDTLGTFRQPNQLNVNLQVAYQASSKVQLVGTFANLVSRCFGAQAAPWVINDSNVCSYGTLNNAGAFAPVGNFYNPGTPFQRLVQYPYAGYLGSVNVNSNSTKTPFNFYLEARIKL